MKKPVSLVTLLLTLLVTVHASTITVDTVSRAYSGEVGIYHNSVNGIDVRDKGVFVAGSSSTAAGTGGCGGAVMMTQAGGTANTAISSGHYFHRVNVTLSSTSLASRCFNVTATFNGLVLPVLYLNSTSTPTVGDFALCTFDLEVASAPSSYTLEVVVQQVS